jgi:hypothetical protein
MVVLFYRMNSWSFCDSAVVDGKPLVSSNQLILDTIPEYTSKRIITPGLVFWILFSGDISVSD